MKQHKCCVLLSLLISGAAAVTNLELVSVIPFGARVATALIYTGASLDIAIDKANRRYNGTLNVSLSLLYGDRDQKCGDAASTIVDQVTHHYYKDRKKDACMALIATSEIHCSTGRRVRESKFTAKYGFFLLKGVSKATAFGVQWEKSVI